jgi:hypothetical protein
VPQAQAPRVTAHTGEPVQQVDSVWLDELGRLYLLCTLPSVGPAFGLVHTLDMLVAAGAVESGQWAPQDMAWADMPGHFGFERMPRP